MDEDEYRGTRRKIEDRTSIKIEDDEDQGGGEELSTIEDRGEAGSRRRNEGGKEHRGSRKKIEKGNRGSRVEEGEEEEEDQGRGRGTLRIERRISRRGRR